MLLWSAGNPPLPVRVLVMPFKETMSFKWGANHIKEIFLGKKMRDMMNMSFVLKALGMSQWGILLFFLNTNLLNCEPNTFNNFWLAPFGYL